MKLLPWVRDHFYDPRLMTKFHTASLVVWALFVPVTLLTGLKDSVPWISFLSVWALATGAWAALQAAHGEKEQDRMLTDLCERIDEGNRILRSVSDRLDAVLADAESRNTTGRLPSADASATGGETWLTKSPSTRASTPDSSPRRTFRSAYVWATIRSRTTSLWRWLRSLRSPSSRPRSAPSSDR